MNPKTLLLLPILVFASCDKDYQVEYAIENDSQRSISIVYQKTDASTIDSSVISRDKTLIFLVEMGEGKKSKDYVNDLAVLPLDLIRIKDLSENELLCNPEDISCWQRYAPDDKDGIGRLTLLVREDSFE